MILGGGTSLGTNQKSLSNDAAARFQSLVNGSESVDAHRTVTRWEKSLESLGQNSMKMTLEFLTHLLNQILPEYLSLQEQSSKPQLLTLKMVISVITPALLSFPLSKESTLHRLCQDRNKSLSSGAVALYWLVPSYFHSQSSCCQMKDFAIMLRLIEPF